MRSEGRFKLPILGSFAEWRAGRTATLDAKSKELAKASATLATVILAGRSSATADSVGALVTGRPNVV